MSTRCEIGIYPEGDYIFNKPYMVFYKHCDGYPEGKYGMKELLKKVWKRISKIERFDDPSYFAAQTLYTIMRLAYEGRIGDGLGFGIQDGFGTQSDIEYYYAIFYNRIEVYATSFNDGTEKWTHKLIETIQMKED